MNSSSRPADSTFPAGIDRTEIAPVQPHATPDEEFPQHQEWDGEPVQPAGDDLDLLAESGRKVTRITVILMAAILAGVAFLGGAVVQKQWGSTSSSGLRAGGTAASGRAGGFGAEGGFGGQAGGFGGGAEGGFGAGAGGTTGGTGTQGGQGTGTGATGSTGSTGSTGTSATPVVVGTVTKVSGRTLSVKNFGGKTITVKVPKGTTITSSSDSALSGLAKGASVSVAGSTASNGTVTATSITAK